VSRGDVDINITMLVHLTEYVVKHGNKRAIALYESHPRTN